jgi:nucleoid-associated protein
MPIQLHHSVIHGFTKEAGQRDATVEKKDRLLDNTLPAVFSLVEGMVNLFGKRESRQVWGRFAHDRREGPFPTGFSGYAGGARGAEAFLQLSGVLVDEIMRMALEQQASTGGHILCADYETEEGHPRFIVAMIKQRSGLQLTHDLVPVSVTEVDMSKLHQAALIRVDEYLGTAAAPGVHAEEGEPEDVDYLSFVAKKADGSSGYFKSALGCAIGVSSTTATTRLYTAVDKVFAENEQLRPFRRPARERLTEFLRQRLGANMVVTMEDVQAVIDRVVPPEHAEHVRDIAQVLNSDRFKVPESFHAQESVVKSHSKVSLDNGRIFLKFDRSMLGQEPQSELYFDEAGRTLTIQNLDEDMMARLRLTLAGG